jgi:hypothetical protein
MYLTHAPYIVHGMPYIYGDRYCDTKVRTGNVACEHTVEVEPPLTCSVSSVLGSLSAWIELNVHCEQVCTYMWAGGIHERMQASAREYERD